MATSWSTDDQTRRFRGVCANRRNHKGTKTPRKTTRIFFVNILVPWCLGGSTAGGWKSEIRNSKSEMGGRAAFLIPNS
jgi:hypothetical protein